MDQNKTSTVLFESSTLLPLYRSEEIINQENVEGIWLSLPL